MPRYDYKCRVCDLFIELKVSVNERDSVKCPHCDNELTRQLSIPAIQFKGSGFYSTDNPKKK